MNREPVIDVTDPVDTSDAGISLASFIAAIPDGLLAGTFLITWFEPTAFGPQMVSHLLLVMLLEFVIMHSSALIGSALFSYGARLTKIKQVVGLTLFYSIFVGGFALSFKTWWPLGAFWGLSLNRLLGSLVGQAPKGREKDLVQQGWGVSAVLYLLFTFATLLLPIPRFGLTDAVVGALELPGEGIWVDEPHRVISFGFLYFSGQTYWSLTAERYLGKWTSRHLSDNAK